METLAEFFVPDIGSAKWQIPWNAVNLLCGVASTAMLVAILSYLIARNNTAKKPRQNWKKMALLISVAVGIQTLLAAASGFLRNPDLEFPLYYPLYPLVEFLDKFLDLGRLPVSPFSHLPLANLGCRIFIVFLLSLVVKAVFWGSEMLSELFAKYLDEQVSESNVVSFVNKVWRFLKKAGLFGVTTAASVEVFTTEMYQEEVRKVLDGLYETLSQITLLSHLPENAATFPEMAYSFFVVVFSILIVASYLLMIVAVCAVVSVLWEKRQNILCEFKQWFKNIGYILLIVAVVLVVVLLSVLFATESASFQEAITLFVQNSPRTIFVLLQHTVMLLAALAIVAVMGVTLAAVVMFGVSFWRAWKQTILVKNECPDSAKRFLRRFGGVFLAGFLLMCFIFGYDPIRGWLIERFANDGSGHGLWWVVLQLCSGFMAAVVVVGVGLLCIYLVLNILAQVLRAFWRLDWTTAGNGGDNTQRISFTHQVKEYLVGLLQTVFRIFKGYQTEDQKNAAIYVAACFASLASLVNTAIGLHDFNIGWILAIAMSFAVQLAMLIFGMKAGQGIAENIVSDVKQVGATVRVAIVRKIVACLCYILAIWAVKYGISILSASPDVLGLSLGTTPLPQYFIPVLLIRVAILIFGYGITKQGLEVISLCYRWRKNRKNKKDDDTDDGLILGNPRRIPARYPLIAYLLFMLVSTTFAFTNLFGGYANQVQLHTRVYDQVYSETEKKLELQETAVDVVDAFLENKQKVLEELRTSYNVLVDKDEENKEKLKKDMDGESTYGEAHNAHQFYINQMADFPAFYESLVSFINREYDLLGEAVTIHVYEYSYYQYGSFRYRTVAFEIVPSGHMEKLTIGNLMEGFDNDNRIVISSLKSENAAEIATTYWQMQKRTVEGANKYVLLNELFAMYENYAKKIMENGVTSDDTTEQSDQGDGIDIQLQAITDHLYNMERLDGIRRNVAELYFAADPDAEQCVSMIDLPRVIDLYLMHEKAVQLEEAAPVETTAPVETSAPTGTTAPPEPPLAENTGDPTGTEEPSKPTDPPVPTNTDQPEEPEIPEKADQKYDKLAAYQDLSDYVDRAIQVYNILNVANDILDLDLEEDAVYTVRTYRSYARGVASSNLQISFDALIKGGLGMNGTDNAINALYSAQMVAVFILIICALVDFMAFFSGLLLFQDIFLLDMKGKSKLSKLGYIAFDAILTKYLMPPERIGDHRKRKIALIYYLLYCEYTKPKNGPIDKKHVDQALLDRLDVNHDAFKVLLYRTLDYLESNSVSIDTPEFHGWMDSFVKKNGIEFDEVLKK